MVSQIYVYVEQHLQDSALTLKWIAENYLFMNVDYAKQEILQRNRTEIFPVSYKNAYWKGQGTDRKKSGGTGKKCSGAGRLWKQSPVFFTAVKKQAGMTPTDYITSFGTLSSL